MSGRSVRIRRDVVLYSLCCRLGLNGERRQTDARNAKHPRLVRFPACSRPHKKASGLHSYSLHTLHRQAPDIPLCFSCPRARARLIVMLRRVLVVAGLAQLSRASASLARTQCRLLLLLASRSRPSASLLGKLSLRNGTKPLRSLSAAHGFSSSTTTSTTVRATLSPSINQSIIL